MISEKEKSYILGKTESGILYDNLEAEIKVVNGELNEPNRLRESGDAEKNIIRDLNLINKNLYD